MEMVTKEMSPQEYFQSVKEKKHQSTDASLSRVYDNCLVLLEKYQKTGQIKGIKKLLFHLDCIEKEREVVAMGIDTFVYRSDIEDYIDNVAKKTVKIIELENYEREIPDEVVSIIERVGNKFSKLYVIFTDYTGKVERTIEKERREKDPILFGVFQDDATRSTIERFYFLGDWVDEHCDLTLDKMVGEMSVKRPDEPIRHHVKTPEDLEELKEQLQAIVATKDGKFRQTENAYYKKKSFFGRIKTAIDVMTGK